MRNYKGFNIPETIGEVVISTVSRGIVPTVHVFRDPDLRINVPITAEEIRAGGITMEEVGKECEFAIDAYLAANGKSE